MTNNIDLDYVDVNLEKLSDDKIEIFKKFQTLLSEKKNNKEVLYLYRGEMLNNMKQTLKEEYQESIFKKLFYYGVKSKFSYSELINEGKEKVFKNINDCSELVLEKIFNDLHSHVKSSKFAERYEINNDTNKVQSYRYIDNKLKEYFENIDNRSVFVNTFQQLTLEKKVLLRDYYLYLTHTSETMPKDTILLSSTTKRSVAKQFTRKKEEDERIVFHYFIFEPYFCHTITPWKMEEIHTWIKNLGLPIYRPTGLYPKQKEVSIKGGLYPHNILGIEFVDKKQFIVNPNLFNFQLESLIENQGIPINQENFLDRIENETNFSSSVWTHDNFCGRFISIKNESLEE